MEPAPLVRRCPFCGTETTQPRCQTCGRDPGAARRVCHQCKRQTPITEVPCMHCKVGPTSELGWKVPVIVLMFVIAIAISIAIHSAR
jgi:predicted amidophosphoribosyltransferase